ncbi:MAG: glycosyltransferase [Candidatus Hadarchaeales archaeon]
MSKIVGIDYMPGPTRLCSSFFEFCEEPTLFLPFPKARIGVGDKFLHALRVMVNLPRLLIKYDTFIFISPPFFHFLCIPILRTFKKRVLTISVDAYTEIVMERLWQGPRWRKILRKLFYPLYVISETLSVKLSHAVFCVSVYLFTKYQKINRNVFYTPNGADVMLISKIKPKRIGKDYIFYMGGFLKWRGIDLLIKAFERVRKTHDVKLLLAGGLEEELKYYPELRSLKWKDVHYLGSLPHEEAISYLKGAKVAVLPSRNTIFSRTISSIKVFEYIAAEIPQVCTESGEHADWVRKLNVGIVVKDTAEDIARGITELLENKKLYNLLKENCRKRKKEIDYRVFRKPWIKYLEKLEKK